MNSKTVISKKVEEETKSESGIKEITKTWVSGQNSCTLIIPRSVAKEYGLECYRREDTREHSDQEAQLWKGVRKN
jgi:hypothetical protein